MLPNAVLRRLEAIGFASFRSPTCPRTISDPHPPATSPIARRPRPPGSAPSNLTFGCTVGTPDGSAHVQPNAFWFADERLLRTILRDLPEAMPLERSAIPRSRAELPTNTPGGAPRDRAGRAPPHGALMGDRAMDGFRARRRLTAQDRPGTTKRDRRPRAGCFASAAPIARRGRRGTPGGDAGSYARGAPNHALGRLSEVIGSR
jgi:hypothetical protein